MNEVATVVGGGSVLFAYTAIVSIFFRLLTSERKENRRLEEDAVKAAARLDAERDTRRKLQDEHNDQIQTLYAEIAELRKRLADHDIEMRRSLAERDVEIAQLRTMIEGKS
jgi:hypothetical protein